MKQTILVCDWCGDGKRGSVPAVATLSLAGNGRSSPTLDLCQKCVRSMHAIWKPRKMNNGRAPLGGPPTKSRREVLQQDRERHARAARDYRAERERAEARRRAGKPKRAKVSEKAEPRLPGLVTKRGAAYWAELERRVLLALHKVKTRDAIAEHAALIPASVGPTLRRLMAAGKVEKHSGGRWATYTLRLEEEAAQA